MTKPVTSSQAKELRDLVTEVSIAVEARIRGEANAVERVKKATRRTHIAAADTPEFWVTETLQGVSCLSLLIAQELGILVCIDEQDGPITAAEIAKKVGEEEQLIIRIMRVLVSDLICEEIAMATYRANELTKIAASVGSQAMVNITYDFLSKVTATIVPYMRDHGFKQFPQRPKEMDPTQYALGGKLLWEHLKDTPEMKQSFDILMADKHSITTPWYRIYPIADELGQSCLNRPNDTLLVDVGGNRGLDILEFHQAYPKLPGRLVLQDLPETIQNIDKKTLARIEVQAYDFFTPQPVKGAKAYFFRTILHDWDDENILKFLPNTVSAMDKDSRILIEEYVFPDTGVSTQWSRQDVLMMVFHSGMERTLNQWKALLASCGLEIVKIWSQLDTDPSVLECRLKQK